MDLRIMKTRRSLANALDSLLKEKLYESITVSEICDRAEVRRATFYDHFHDKEALLVYTIRELIADYKRKIFERFPQTERNPKDFYIYVIQQTLELFEENRKHIGNAMISETFSLFTYLWQNEIYLDIKKHIEADQKNGMHFSMPADLSARLFCGVISGLFSWMMEHKGTVDYEMISHKLDLLLFEQQS